MLARRTLRILTPARQSIIPLTPAISTSRLPRPLSTTATATKTTNPPLSPHPPPTHSTTQSPTPGQPTSVCPSGKGMDPAENGVSLSNEGDHVVQEEDDEDSASIDKCGGKGEGETASDDVRGGGGGGIAIKCGMEGEGGDAGEEDVKRGWVE
ncbi:hypothetical protein HK104_009292 [Borealophlyctis nickersoniae]|nr:hypothetical protein HK104_009292 [Borealophlyctis nickersoniae]